MPIIGLGVRRMQGQEIKDLIINSIKIGYHHFDCAADYKNETEVGEAFKEAFDTGFVKREDLFITTKLWKSDHGHVIEACKDSLKKLQLDYLDLYLVHLPVATRHTGVDTTDSALGEDGVLDIDTTISLETTWHAMEGVPASISFIIIGFSITNSGEGKLQVFCLLFLSSMSSAIAKHTTYSGEEISPLDSS
ncbi:hypothetical protein RYX36_012240 [Vicia faba]